MRDVEAVLVEQVLAVAAEPTVVPGIAHHHLLLLLLQVVALLLLARSLGYVAARFGMPTVLGELLAGIVLGPSVLGAFAPGAFEWLFPPEPLQRNLLDLLAFVGVILLLLLTGLEVDLALIASKGRTALKVSAGGIVVPFVLGALAAAYLVPDALLTDSPRLTLSLFMGTALAISAIPVIAKVLIDLKMIKRDIGQLTLAAAMVDDAVGWALLSVVAGLAQSGSVDALVAVRALLTVVAVVGITLTVGRRLFGALLRWVDIRLPGQQPKLTLIVVLGFAMAALTMSLGIEAVLGAFLVGIAFGTLKRFDHHLVEVIETWVLAVFAPLFFARAGLSVDLGALFTSQTLLVGALVLAVAIVGKFAGAYAGAVWAGLGPFEALSLGAGMNARGALEIIVATIGLNLGILGPELYAVVVMIAIVTSLMAPPLLRTTMSRVPLSASERARLERDERLRTSFLGNIRRVLLPCRGAAHEAIAAQVISRVFMREEVELTLVVLDGAAVGDLELHLSVMQQLELRRIVRASDDEAAAVLDEAARGYDLLVIGATETRSRLHDESALFSPFEDRIVRDAPCPVMIVSARVDGAGGQGALELRRIVLPTLGEQADRRAAEVAFAAARDPGAVVHAVHFLLSGRSVSADMSVTAQQEARGVAEAVVKKEATMGERAAVTVLPEVVATELSIEEAIVAYASEVDADLIVFRSDERAVTQRAFFSHQLDHILSQAPCPVVIISGG